MFLFVRYIITDLIVLYIGIDLVLTYSKVEFHQPTRKIRNGRISWILLGVMSTFIGLIRGIAFLVASIGVWSNQNTVSFSLPIIRSTEFVSTYGYGIFALTMLFVVFISPETLVMTRSQLLNVEKLYDIVAQLNKDQAEARHDKWTFPSSIDQVIDYCSS